MVRICSANASIWVFDFAQPLLSTNGLLLGTLLKDMPVRQIRAKE